MKKPYNVDVDVWRKSQLSRYIENFPHQKPRSVKKWIDSHHPNPWPTCTTKELSRIAMSIKKSWKPVKSNLYRWNYSMPRSTNINK